MFVNKGTGNLWGQAVVSNCEGSRQEKEGLICLGGRTPTNFETWVSSNRFRSRTFGNEQRQMAYKCSVITYLLTVKLYKFDLPTTIYPRRDFGETTGVIF